MDKRELLEISQLSAKELALSVPPIEKMESKEIVISWLSKQILHLLRHNFDQLVNALYRIDVSELKVKEVFNGQDELMVSEAIAQLIFEREKEKINSRRKYRKG